MVFRLLVLCFILQLMSVFIYGDNDNDKYGDVLDDFMNFGDEDEVENNMYDSYSFEIEEGDARGSLKKGEEGGNKKDKDKGKDKGKGKTRADFIDFCQDQDKWLNKYFFNRKTEKEISKFKHPVLVDYLENHVVTKESQILKLDNSRMVLMKEKFGFLFGGKDRFGDSDLGRIFDIEKCSCENLKYTCDNCPPKHKVVTGIWQLDQPIAISDDVENAYVPPRPAPREDHSMVAYGDVAYIFGGIADEYPMKMWTYNITSQAYVELEHLVFGENGRMGRKNMCTFTLENENKMYVYGGEEKLDQKKKILHRDLWEYDFETTIWNRIFSEEDCNEKEIECPDARIGFMCEKTNVGGFVLFGGSIPGKNVTFPDDTWYFSLRDKRWYQRNFHVSPPGVRRGTLTLKKNLDKDQIYLQGGTNGITNLKNLWVLEIPFPTANNNIKPMEQWRWIQIPLTEPVVRTNCHTSLVYKETLFTFFGSDTEKSASSLLGKYDISGTVCPNDCVEKGVCVQPGICQCSEGYTGPNCNQILPKIEFITVDFSASIGCSITSLFVLIGCIVCVVLMVKYRNSLGVKVTSPSLNNTVIVGCILALVGVIFISENERTLEGKSPITKDNYSYDMKGSFMGWHNSICHINAAWFLLCFSISYSALLSKIRHVDLVFNQMELRGREKNPKSLLKNITIETFVFVLFPQTLLLILWFVISPLYFEWELIPPKEELSITLQYVGRCKSKYQSEFLLAVGLLNGFFLLIGARVAWKTRYIEVFSDSRNIGIAIYNMLVVSVPSFLFARLLTQDPNASLLALTFGVCLTVIGILIFVIVPTLRNRNIQKKALIEKVKKYRAFNKEKDDPARARSFNNNMSDSLTHDDLSSDEDRNYLEEENSHTSGLYTQQTISIHQNVKKNKHFMYKNNNQHTECNDSDFSCCGAEEEHYGGKNGGMVSPMGIEL